MNQEEKQKVLIVDDHPLFRKGVMQLIELSPGLEPMGEVGTYDEAVNLVMTLHPDMVLLDLNMKGTSGIEILSAIKSFDPGIRVVMLTVSDSPADVLQCLRAGADGYLLKDSEPEEILKCLIMAGDCQTIISPALTGKLSECFRDDHAETERSVSVLTPRERDVLRCIACGMSNKLIARELEISDGTVKVHVKQVLRKLSFRSRVEAAVWVKEQKLF